MCVCVFQQDLSLLYIFIIAIVAVAAAGTHGNGRE